MGYKTGPIDYLEHPVPILWGEFGKEIVFGRTLVEKLIRHVMRTYLDAGFVCTSRAWIRSQLEIVEFTTTID